MKINYTKTNSYFINPASETITFSIGMNMSGLNWVIQMLKISCIPYYILQVEEVLKGKKEKICIWTDEVHDAPEDCIIVGKKYSYSKDESDKKIETNDLLEFLKIMKRELELGDEIVVDPRCDQKVDKNFFSKWFGK